MPFDAFLEFISHDDIEVKTEQEVVKMVQKYMQKRNTVQPLLPEEDPVNDLSHLTEEEKKKREESKAKQDEEENKKKEEEKKARDEKLAKLDELGKMQFELDEKQQEKIKKMESNNGMKRLTKD